MKILTFVYFIFGLSLNVLSQLGTPTLSSPADGASVKIGSTLSLVWTAVSGATSYDVEFDNGTSYSSIVNVPTYNNRDFLVNNNFGTHTWRVRAKNETATGEWSASRSYNVTSTLNTPTLSSPEDGTAVKAGSTLSLTWTTVTGATSYDVEFDNGTSNASVVNVPTNNNLDVVVSNNPGFHTWRVRARSRSTISAWSDSRNYTVTGPVAIPTTVSPTNGATIICESSTSFLWNSVSNATGYQIQFDSETAINVSDTSYSRLFNTLGNHSWKVQATSAAGNSGWSNVNSFTVSLRVPTLSSPLNGATVKVDSTLSLVWTAVPCATSYDVEFDNGTSSASVVNVLTNNNLNVVVSNNPGSHTWRVRANNGTAKGEWSASRNYTVSVPPVIPTTVSPINGAIFANGTLIKFTWNSVLNATGYQIQFDSEPAINVSDTIYCRSFNTLGNHSWKVRAISAAGNSGWSAVNPFTVSIGTPIDGSANNALIFTIDSTFMSCYNSNNGLVKVNASGGTPDYWYAINSTNTWFKFEAGQSNKTYIATEAGVYKVWVKDANGCQAGPDETTLKKPEQLSATITTTGTSCNGESTGTATVIGKGGWTGISVYNYKVDNGSWTSSTSFTGLKGGSHKLYIKDVASYSAPYQPLSCIDSMMFNISEPAPFVYEVSVTGVSISGNDGTFTINITSGGTPSKLTGYKVWLTGNNYNSGVKNTGAGKTNYKFEGLAKSFYTVHIQDSLGCILPASVGDKTSPYSTEESWEVDEPVTPLTLLPEKKRDVTCNGGADGQFVLKATGGKAPYSYYSMVSNPGSGQVLVSPPANAVWQESNTFNVAAGTWVAWVKDANGNILGGEQLNGAPVNAWRVEITQPAVINWMFYNPKYNAPKCYGEANGEILIYGIAGGNGGDYTAKVSGKTAAGVDFIYTEVIKSTGSYIIKNIPAGFYNVTVLDKLMCTSKSDTVTVKQATKLMVDVVKGADQFQWNDSIEGVIIANATGGTPFYSVNTMTLKSAGTGVGMPYMYQLLKNGVVWTPWQNINNSFLVQIGNTYIVQVKDASGCIAADTISINPNCMTIISPKDGEACVKNDIVLTMEFCQKVTPGNVNRLVKVYNILENGLSVNKIVYSTPVTTAMINGNTVKIPVNGLVDNVSYIVMIDADAIRDEAGNPYQGITDPITWNFTTGDNKAPTAILVPFGSINNKNEFVVYAVFSEPVLGAVAAIKVEGATSSSLKVSAIDNKLYEIAITAPDKATVTVTLPVTITDANCRFNPLSQEVKRTYVVGDNTAPSVTVTSSPPDSMNTMNNFTVKLTFSEKVNGVTAALAGSTGITGVTTVDGIVYSAAFAGADGTKGKLVLDKNLVTDVSENANKLTEGIRWDYLVGDHEAPTALVDPTMGADLRVQTLNVKVTFSRAVVVPEGGIVVTGGVGTITSTGNIYNVAITAIDGATVKLNLTSLITDDSKNANKLAASEYTYIFGDRTAPVVTVFKPGAKDTIPTFDVTIGFSEKVKGVSTSSITLTGIGAILNLRTIVEGLVYEATISGAEQSNLILGFSNAIRDMSDNALVPVNFNYSIGDINAPTVMADPATGNFVTNMFEVTLTFNENVSGVASAVAVSSGTVTVTGSGKIYVVKFNAPGLSTVKLNLGTGITDAAGNKLAAATYSYNVTGIVPISTIQNTPLEGVKLQVQGTVTAIAAGEGFFVQDASAVWSGIWVKYFNVGAANIKIGDGVLVTGEVAEVANVTSVVASAVAKSGTGLAIVPLKVTPNEAKAEKYESVLVKVDGARASAPAAGTGEWTIYYQKSDSVLVNDWLYFAMVTKGNFYEVTGIVNARLDNYKLEPRIEPDVKDLTITKVDPELANTFKVYPNPFHDQITIDNFDKLTRVVIRNVAGQKVIDIEYPNREIRAANLVSGVYVISLFTEDGIAKTERMIKR